MEADRYAELKETIKTAIRQARMAGITIVPGSFGLSYRLFDRQAGNHLTIEFMVGDNKCCCPIGATLIDKRFNHSGFNSSSIPAIVAHTYNVSVNFIISFTSAFDGIHYQKSYESDPDGYRMGREVYAEMM